MKVDKNSIKLGKLSIIKFRKFNPTQIFNVASTILCAEVRKWNAGAESEVIFYRKTSYKELKK